MDGVQRLVVQAPVGATYKKFSIESLQVLSDWLSLLKCEIKKCKSEPNQYSPHRNYNICLWSLLQYYEHTCYNKWFYPRRDCHVVTS